MKPLFHDFKGDRSNVLFLIICKGKAMLGLMDQGESVNIIKKRCLGKMGCPCLETMELQVCLAIGGLVKSLGLLHRFRGFFPARGRQPVVNSSRRATTLSLGYFINSPRTGLQATRAYQRRAGMASSMV